MKTRTRLTAAASLGLVLAATLATPALALGRNTNGKITGYSYRSGGTPACSLNLCAFTQSEAGRTTLTVQLTSAGSLVAGTKVTTTGTPATYTTAEDYYAPGGRHTGFGTTINT